MGSLERFLENHPALNRDGDQEFTRAVWGGIAGEYDTLQANVSAASDDSAVLENLQGDMLDELILRTTGIPRITNESDASRIKILYSLFRRSGQGSWATKHAIKGAYQYYFPETTIYVMENVIETNLIDEGSFEAFDSGVKAAQFGQWFPSGASIEVEQAAGFQGAKSVKGTGTGALYQDIVFASSGPAILTTAYRGKLPITIERLSDNKYWNPATMAWQAGAASISLENLNPEYALVEHIVVIEAAATVRVTYGPDPLGSEWHIDYLSFGLKPGYPFVKVLVSTFGQSGEYLNAWLGTNDPVPSTDYDNATFLEQDFLGGEGGGVPTAYYQTILDYIKPAGVKALFEFVGRE